MKIGFKNFKSFAEDHYVSLGNFNVITGKNNSGKSSLSDLIYYYLLLKNRDIDQHPLLNASAEKIIRLTTAWKFEGRLNADQENLAEKDIASPIKLYDEELKAFNQKNTNHKIFDPLNFIRFDENSFDKADYIFGQSNWQIYSTLAFGGPLGSISPSAPFFNDNNSISMSYEISDVKNIETKLNNESKQSYRDYIGDTMAKKEGLLVHRNLISCDCNHTEDLFYEEFNSYPTEKNKDITYASRISHEDFFKQRLKDKKFYLTDLIKLDCFDDDIKKAITAALDQTVVQKVKKDDSSYDNDDPLDTLEFVYDDTLTLLKATKAENLFTKTEANSSPMITPEQCKKIIDTLKENVFCFSEGIDLNDCARCEICRYNLHCINDPINYTINEYIHSLNDSKNKLQKELEGYNKAKLIFEAEFNGISFGADSPTFLEGLHLARERRKKHPNSLVTFNSSSNNFRNKNKLTVPTSTLITDTVDRLASVVFQEKLEEIDCFHQNPSFTVSLKQNPSELYPYFLEKGASDEALLYQIELDIDLSSKQLDTPFYSKLDLSGKISTRVLLTLHPQDPMSRVISLSGEIYPKNHIFADILFNKNINESWKKKFFGDAFIDKFKKLSFTKKNYQTKFLKFLSNDLESKNQFATAVIRGAGSEFKDGYLQKKEFLTNYVREWKNNDPIGKEYEAALMIYFASSTNGNYKTSYSIACKKGSQYKRKAISTIPIRSPYMNSTVGELRYYKEGEKYNSKTNLLNQFIPFFDLEESIRINVHNRPNNKAVIDYGSINDWKNNSSLSVTLSESEGEDELPANPENNIYYPYFDNIELKVTPGKKIYHRNKKVNYFPPTVGPLFHINSQFGFDLLEHGKVGDKFENLKKELFYSRRENLLKAFKFLGDVKLNEIANIIDYEKIKQKGIIDINPSLGKDIISVEKFKNLLNAESYNIPYSSLSILAVYSRIVRDVLQDVNFSVMERNQKLIDFINNLKDDKELQKTPAANKKITSKDLFKSRISPAVIKKVAKKYKIRQKDVPHQAQVILNFILMKLINRFEKTAHSLIHHDYLKQVQELNIDLLPENLSADDKLDVEIINPVVWKPYHKGIERSDSNSASLDEIKTFLGRNFHRYLSTDVRTSRKTFDDSESDFPTVTSLIIRDINRSLKAIGTDLTFSIRPIFSKEVEYINDVEKNSRQKFSGNFRMFVSSKTVESPLDKAGEGISALISIFARIHSLRRNNVLLRDQQTQLTVSIIREPENHLHPNFIAKLIEHIFEISNFKQKEPWQLLNKRAKDGSATKRMFILETHSEVVLRQTQASIKKHSSKNKNLESLVKVYYVDQKSAKENFNDKFGKTQKRTVEKSSIRDLKLKNNGFFDRNIPKGFFDINTNLIADLWKDDYKPKKRLRNKNES